MPRDRQRPPDRPRPADRRGGADPRRSGRTSRQPPARRSSPWSNTAIAGIVVIVGLVAVAGVVLLFGGGPSLSASPSPGGSAAAHGTNCPTSQPAALGAGQTRTVTIDTDLGTIVVKVKADLSPIATGNFVALASCGFYDGLVFHRVVQGFVIQGGDPNGDGSGGPGYTIADEPVTATYTRGTVAMARTPDAHSQGSQFFIVLDDSAAQSLTNVQSGRGYAILGNVTSGMDVVDQIAQAADQELPTDPVAMNTVTVANP